MRIRIFLTLILSLCMADSGAFAANARGTRGVNNTQNTTVQSAGTAVAARAANRQKVANTGVKTNSAPAATGNVSARAGKKQQVVNAGAKTSGQPMAARAGATQKVINTGTKVATATENTVVPEECQNAFYGCMDAFCMLDNATGGRCQCSDKITELDKVLEDILKLDEQSYVMATEGVERIQMGEAEEQIMARAKAAGEKAANANKESADNKKKARQLDLSSFNNNIFSDADEDVFSLDDAQNSLTDKKGDALFKETTKMCAAQIPAQCKTYGNMLSMVYAQKIKSDCIAYENSLKAQKNQSQQKLQTAQKALREAALDEYKNQNRYETVGECVIEFTKCIQTTAECGEDYTGCVTLAARENLTNTKAGSKKAKQTKIKGSVAGADITLAATTMEQLLAKKTICERVTKQCVNANKNDAVWNAFLKNAAPALKSAELIAEQNLRSNCIPTVAECFKNACKAQFGDNDENYDMCLSNPETYKNLCKVQLEPCLEATGGTFEKAEESTLWNGLVAMLGAMKVDACTKEVKDCLMERCGEDYSGCIGLDTASIGNLCPDAKLTACMDKYDKDTVKDYIAEIAQGLALQIDNALATACQNAAQEAMIKICGDAESCNNATFDLSSLESQMSVQICPSSGNCVSSLAMIETINADETLTLRDSKYKATLIGAPDISAVAFNYDESADNKAVSFTTDSKDTGLKSVLDSALNRIMTSIETDPKVIYCREGREVQGFEKMGNFGKKGKENARFPNLTDSYRTIVADSLLEQLSTKNAELTSKFTKQIAELDNQIAEKIYAGDEVKIDEQNQKNCENYTAEDIHRTTYHVGTVTKENDCSTESYRERHIACRKIKQLTDKVATYDSATNVCTITTTKYDCKNFKHRIGGGYCDQFDDGTVLNTETIQMAKSN